MPDAENLKPQPVARPRWFASALPYLVAAAVVTGLHLPALLGGVYFLDVYSTEVHPHLVEVQRIAEFLGNAQVPEMNGVERAPQEADRPHRRVYLAAPAGIRAAACVRRPETRSGG